MKDLLGKKVILKATRQKEQGWYLSNTEGEEVLLPNKYVPEGFGEDDEIEVFLYNDSEDRPVATTLSPKIELDSIAFLEVKSNGKYGGFFDWGLEKDLMVPHNEQTCDIEEGEVYPIYLYLDKKSNRLAGSMYLSKFIKNEDVTISVGDEVNLFVFDETEIGFSVLIEEKWVGIAYKSEVFKDLMIGDRIKGFIKKLREDGKIDVALEKFGYRKIEPHAQKLLDFLKKNNGRMNYTDKSSPEEIKELFEMSKKSFKKALGSLYKQRMINIQDDGVYLVEDMD